MTKSWKIIMLINYEQVPLTLDYYFYPVIYKLHNLFHVFVQLSLSIWRDALTVPYFVCLLFNTCVLLFSCSLWSPGLPEFLSLRLDTDGSRLAGQATRVFPAVLGWWRYQSITGRSCGYKRKRTHKTRHTPELLWHVTMRIPFYIPSCVLTKYKLIAFAHYKMCMSDTQKGRSAFKPNAIPDIKA